LIVTTKGFFTFLKELTDCNNKRLLFFLESIDCNKKKLSFFLRAIDAIAHICRENETLFMIVCLSVALKES